MLQDLFCQWFNIIVILNMEICEFVGLFLILFFPCREGGFFVFLFLCWGGGGGGA